MSLATTFLPQLSWGRGTMRSMVEGSPAKPAGFARRPSTPAFGGGHPPRASSGGIKDQA